MTRTKPPSPSSANGASSTQGGASPHPDMPRTLSPASPSTPAKVRLGGLLEPESPLVQGLQTLDDPFFGLHELAHFSIDELAAAAERALRYSVERPTLA